MCYELSDRKYGGTGQAAGAQAGRRAFAAYTSSRRTIRAPLERDGDFRSASGALKVSTGLRADS
jgi:hypothetical protein